MDFRWVFLATIGRLEPAESLTYRSTTGHRLKLERRGSGRSVDDFAAYPACEPCAACRSGSPEECIGHGTDLECDAPEAPERYELRVEGDLLFVAVPVENLIGANGSQIPLLVEDTFRKRRAPRSA